MHKYKQKLWATSILMFIPLQILGDLPPPVPSGGIDVHMHTYFVFHEVSIRTRFPILGRISL